MMSGFGYERVRFLENGEIRHAAPDIRNNVAQKVGSNLICLAVNLSGILYNG
jgi:hypothetical protein